MQRNGMGRMEISFNLPTVGVSYEIGCSAASAEGS
jgi:hypothetical protein